MKKLLAILMLTATPALAAEEISPCDAVYYAEEGEELIITGEINKLSSKSAGIFDPNEKDCDFSVDLKKQAPKDCKVGSVATVQGKAKLDEVLGEHFEGLTNATIKCAAAAARQPQDFRQLTRDEILMVQTFLYDNRGFVFQGPPDGKMNEQTRIALAQAQKEAGFNVTGELTKDQFDLIKEVAKEPLPERDWAAISIATSVENGHVIVSKVKTGSKAHREAETKCKEKYPSGNCVTGVTWGTPAKPAWVAGMWCKWKEEGRPFVSFGGTEQDAYDLVAKQIQKAGIAPGNCNRVASVKSDGTR